MKNLFRRVLNVLDGQPAGARGQSLVELAFTTPILFLMIVSTAEVGYLANNYLVLLDAVREGARNAVTQSPRTGWNDADSRNQWRTACYDGDQKLYNLFPGQTPGLTAYHGPAGYTQVTSLGSKAPVGFFDSTACQVIASMEPLSFDVSGTGETPAAQDDISVSAVGYVNLCTAGPCSKASTQNGQPDIPTGTRQLVITGRWPLANRMCNSGPGADSRDPFRYPGRSTDAAKEAALPPLPADYSYRGFVMTGQNAEFFGANPSCYGSRFHVGGTDDGFDLERILNDPKKIPNGGETSVLKSVPNGGMVIVELSWRHHQLFGFPPLNFLGNPNLYIYQMFPVTGAEATPTSAPTAAGS